MKIKNKIIILITIILLTSTLANSLTTENEDTFLYETQTIIESYIYNFTLSTTELYILNNIFLKLDVEDGLQSGEVGRPSLPVYISKILIPQGKQIESITVTPENSFDIPINYPVMPKQRQRPISEPTNVEFYYDTDFYANHTDLIFNKYFDNNNIHYMYGYPILTLTLYPVDYDIKNQKILFYESLIVDITYASEYETSSNTNNFYRNQNKDKEEIENFIDNPLDAITYNTGYSPQAEQYEGGLCSDLDNYDYVIITNDDLRDAGSPYNWTDLLDHRLIYGISGTIVTVEEIYAESDYWGISVNDSQYQIREFCKDAYLDWGTDYILIGGDWDESVEAKQIVPYREFLTGYNSEKQGNSVYASSLYYANLDGDWVHPSESGYYGGVSEGHDAYSELKVGRLTVSEADHVSNIVKKIIDYDLCNDTDFLDHVAFFGGNLGWSITSKDYMEDIRNGTGQYRTETDGFVQFNANNSLIAFNISTRLYDAWGASLEEWENEINNENVSIINHLGHGNPSHSLGGLNIGSLTNQKYIFIYTQECSSGRYKEGDTTEKRWTVLDTDYGAFATIQNTGYGWGSGVSTDGPNQYMQRCFWDYIFNTTITDWQIGSAITHARNMMGAYCIITLGGGNYGDLGAWYGSTLFGDPSQNLKSKPFGAYEHDIGISIRNLNNSQDHRIITNAVYAVNVSVYNFGNNTENNIDVNLYVDDVLIDQTTITSINSMNYVYQDLEWYVGDNPNSTANLTVNVSGYGTDNYAGNDEDTWTLIIGPDVGVSSFSLSNVSKGTDTNFSATVKNYAITNQSVLVQFKINEEEIDNTTIELDSSEYQTVTFSWNASTYALGTYTAEIYANEVPDERYTENQNVSSVVRVYAPVNFTDITFTPNQNTSGTYVNISLNVTCEQAINSITFILESATAEDMELLSGDMYYYNLSLDLMGFYLFNIEGSTDYATNSYTNYAIRTSPQGIWNQDKDTTYNSITEALADANENNTIYVGNGTYRGNISFSTPVHITANYSESTIIDGFEKVAFNLTNEGVNYIEISNFTILNCSTAILIHGGLYAGVTNLTEPMTFASASHHNTVHNCTINNSQRAIHIKESQYNTISNNLFGTVIREGIYMDYPSSLWFFDGFNTISNNTFHVGIYPPVYTSCYPIHIEQLCSNIIEHNTFSEPEWQEHSFGAYKGIDFDRTKFNIIQNNDFDLHGACIYDVQASDGQRQGDSFSASSYNTFANNTILHRPRWNSSDYMSAIRIHHSVSGQLYERIYNNTINTTHSGIACYDANFGRWVTIANNTIRRIDDDGSNANGISLDIISSSRLGDEGYETITDNVITGYTYGIKTSQYAGSGTNAHRCDIYNNSLYGIYNPNGLFIFNASDCYWGSADGPDGEGPGNGDNVSIKVTYSPYSDHPLSDESDILERSPTGLIEYNPTNFSGKVYDNKTFSVYWYCDDRDGNLQLFGSNLSLSAGYHSIRHPNPNITEGEYGQYNWSLNVTDGTYWTNQSYTFTYINDTTGPSIEIIYVGAYNTNNDNTIGSGGPKYQPPYESSEYAREGYYTNMSKQSYNYFYMYAEVIDDLTDISSVWINILNETTWINNTYELELLTGSYFLGDNKWGIRLSTSEYEFAEGYNYSFDVWANDTSIHNNTNYSMWNKTGLGGDYTRRYVQIDCDPNDDISYCPFYYAKIGYYWVYDTNKPDRLMHDQGGSNSGHIIGSLNSSLTDYVRLLQTEGSTTIINWFDESVCITETTIENVYFHVWWNTPNMDEYASFSFRRERDDIPPGTLLGLYERNITNIRSTISYGGAPYSLDTNLLDITDTTVTSNSVYELYTRFYSTDDVKILCNTSFKSFIIFNVPENSTLATMDTDSDNLNDWEELYYTYTSPFHNDTDNDGYTDYYENLSGSDPNNYSEAFSDNPIIIDIDPDEDAFNLPLTPWLNVTVNDIQGDNFNITWLHNYTGDWITFAHNSSCSNGTYRQRATWSNAPWGRNWWKIEINDTKNYWTNRTLSFTCTGSDNPELIFINNGINGTTINSSNPTFVWSIVLNATIYWLRIATDSNFENEVANITEINEYTFPSNYSENINRVYFLLPNDYKLEGFNTYYVEVKALVK